MAKVRGKKLIGQTVPDGLLVPGCGVTWTSVGF